MAYHYKEPRYIASDIKIDYERREVSFSNHWSKKKMGLAILQDWKYMDCTIGIAMTVLLIQDFSLLRAIESISLFLIILCIPLIGVLWSAHQNFSSFFIRKAKPFKIHEIVNPLKISMITSSLIEVEYEGDATTPHKTLEFTTRNILNEKKVSVFHELKIIFANQCLNGKVTIKELR